MTTEIGIYGLVKLMGALLATTAAGPLGPVDLPAGPLLAPPAPHSGLVLYADGSSAGRLGRPGEGVIGQAQAPQLLVDAIIASEDASFGQHPGVDPVATLRAILSQLGGGRVQGASTLTQQTIKNALLTPERSLERKIAEAVIALRVSQVMQPRDILGVYLETVYFGRGAHGFSAAAQAWFSKDWAELTVGEVAFIAGVVQSPSFLDPLKNPERAKQRRDYVLGRLAATGIITEAVAMQEKSVPLKVAPQPTGHPGDYNWATAAALRDWPEQGAAQTNAAGEDAFIKTTLDARWQELIDTSVPTYLQAKFPAEAAGHVNLDDGLTPDDWTDARAVLPGPSSEWELGIVTGGREVTLANGRQLEWDADYSLGAVVAVQADGDIVHDLTAPGVQAAVIVMNVKDGSVLASLGGFDPSMTRLNRAWSNRQLGSSVKPFLWLAALESGMPFDEMVLDSPVTIQLPGGENWTPANYDGGYSGAMPLFAALEQSSNLAAARLGQAIGIPEFARVAEAAGVYGPGQMRQHPSAVLGTTETSLLQLTAGYAAIANGGLPVDPHVVTSISGGTTSWIWRPPSGKRPIADEASIASLQAMLRGVIVRGTASVAFADSEVPIAGKTGTSQGHRDAWFVGFNENIAIGVWLGRDDNTPIGVGATGGTLAAQIAAQIFTFAEQDGLLPPDSPSWPPAPLEHRGFVGAGTWTAQGMAGSQVLSDDAAEEYLGDAVSTSPSGPANDYFAVDNPNADLLGGHRPYEDGGLVYRSPW